MKLFAAAIASLIVVASSAQAQERKAMHMSKPMLSSEEVRSAAPALDKYAQDRLLGDVWKRPGLNPRDRSIVTLAALIARNQTVEMPYYLTVALDSGVKPREVSEIITHLAFYSGWANAMSAVAVAKDVFAERKLGDQLPAASPPLLPINEGAGGGSREARGRAIRRRVSVGGSGHDRRSVPRSVASARSRAARPQPGYGQRANRLGPGRANSLSPQSRDG
jgi:4-carboxymuconolactone decarboxylase